MSEQIETFADNGWDRVEAARCFSEIYKIKDRKNARPIMLGQGMADRPEQTRVCMELWDSFDQGGAARWLWLKPRRSGYSTIIQVTGLHLAIRCGLTFGTLAHNDASTEELFFISKFAFESLPPEQRPELRYDRGTQMVFGIRKRSDRDEDDSSLLNKLITETAGGRHPFAGASLQILHGSEVAKWPGDEKRQENTIANILNTMPMDGPSLAVMETTGNGPRGWFYNQWCEAVKYANRPGFYEWRVQFTPWFLDPGSRRKVRPDELRTWKEHDKEDLEREEELVRRFGVDMQQLRFRRAKIEELGSVDRWNSDFPATWQSAFQDSAAAVFDPNMIARQRAEFGTDPIRRGDFSTTWVP